MHLVPTNAARWFIPAVSPLGWNLMRTSLQDAAHTMRIVRTHARTFWLASHFLPTEKRRAAYALYAFCRVADDVVDGTPSDDGHAAALLLGAYRQNLDVAITGDAQGPVLREVMAAVARYDIPTAALHELLDGVARDCEPVRYATWDSLASYCEGVASSVGEMCAAVFGVSADPLHRATAIRHARTLGLAMQLTNILRDVGVDYAQKRLYLPAEDMARFGVTEDDIARECSDAGAGVKSPAVRALLEFEAERAHTYFAKASLELPEAERRAVLAAEIMRAIYEETLRRIEAEAFDVFSRVIRLRRVTQARIAAGVLWDTTVGRLH